jgi:hypothetical protein
MPDRFWKQGGDNDIGVSDLMSDAITADKLVHIDFYNGKQILYVYTTQYI